MIPGNERRHWYLPLVGGAEMNRIKPPRIIYFTSRPYPLFVRDDLTTALAPVLLRHPPEGRPLDHTRMSQTVMSVTITGKLFNGKYAGLPELTRVSLNVTSVTITGKLGKVVMGTRENARVSLGITNILRFRGVLPYPREVGIVRTSLNIVSVTKV